MVTAIPTPTQAGDDGAAVDEPVMPRSRGDQSPRARPAPDSAARPR